MKILFIGTVEFSLHMLEKLVSLDIDLVGVCTKKHSGFNSDFADLTPLCKLHSIPYLHLEDINSKESVQWIKRLNPDVIFCFGWSFLLKKEVLTIPKLGVVGYHPAKLPKNRGRHPLIWALVLGLESSASTFFFMNESADSGDILSQVDFNISYKDDAASVYKKVVDVALQQVEDIVFKLQNGTLSTVKQDNSVANTWRRRTELDGLIDFRMNSRSIYNLTRALTRPYMGAHINYNGNNFSVWKVKEVEDCRHNFEPGMVLEAVDRTFVVKSYDGAIEIMEHDFDTLPKVGEYL